MREEYLSPLSGIRCLRCYPSSLSLAMILPAEDLDGRVARECAPESS